MEWNRFFLFDKYNTHNNGIGYHQIRDKSTPTSSILWVTE